MKNLAILKLLIILASAVLFPAPVKAELIDHGDYFADTHTNTHWLDLTITTGQTIAQVDARLASGGDLQGWQFATTQDYKQLTMTADYLAQFPGAQSMPYVARDFAATMVLYLLNTSAPEEFSSVEYSPDAIYGFVGVLRDHEKASYGYIAKWEYDLFTEVRATPNTSQRDGVFLIRKQVAEPSAIILFMVGILGLMFCHNSMK